MNVVAPVQPQGTFQMEVIQDEAMSLIETQGIIQRQLDRKEQLQEEAKKYKEQLESILENDEALSNQEEEAKQYRRKVTERKAIVMNSAEAMQIKYKLQEVREGIKDLNDSLNNHLGNYEKLSGGQLMIDFGDGSPVVNLKKKYTVSRG